MATALREVVDDVGKRSGRHRAGYRRPKQQYDEGTPELRAKREAIVGRDGDPSKSTNPLEAMMTRGYITLEQCSAGRRYGWLYQKALGRKLDGDPTRSDPTVCGEAATCPKCEDCSALKIANAWRRAHAALPDRRAKDELENAAVYQRWPRWFLVQAGRIIVHRPSDTSARNALTRALDALVAIGCVVREKGPA